MIPRTTRARRASVIEQLELRRLLAIANWTGASGNGNWFTASNWDGGVVPAVADDAVIPANATATNILIDGAANLHSLTSAKLVSINGGQSLQTSAASMFSGGLTLAGGRYDSNGAATIAGAFAMTGGTLGGAGVVTVSGTHMWTAGSMDGTGTTVLAAGSSLTINSASTHRLDRTLELNSTTDWVAGDVQFSTGIVINNGTFISSTVSSLAMYGVGGTNAFVNNAVFNKTGTGTTFITVSSSGVPLNNFGTVNVNAGTLSVAGFGSSSGKFNVPAGAELNFNRDYAFNGAAGDIDGLGALTLSGGNLAFDSSFTIEAASVAFSGSTIAGTGTTTFTGACTWSAGMMAGTGKTLLPAGSSMTMNSATTKRLDRTLQIDSNTTWLAGDFQFSNGTLINNGTFTMSTATSLTAYGVGGLNLLRNNATLRKNGAGSATITVSSSGVPLDNLGAVNVEAGAFAVSGFGTSTGTFDISNGASLSFGRDYTFNVGADINGSGSLALTGGNLFFDASFTVESPSVTLDGANLSGSGTTTFVGACVWSSGNMSGTGTTLLPAGSSLTINSGSTHRLDRILRVDSTTHWLAGDFQFNGGTFVNNGTFNATSKSTLQAYGVGGINVFANNSTFNKTLSGTTFFFVSSSGVPLNNFGVIIVDAGTLDIGGFGLSTGTFNIDSNASLVFRRDYAFNAGSDINGAGALSMIGGNLAFNTPFTVESASVALDGASLTGSATTTFNGAFTWSSGAMTGTGTTIIPASLLINSANAHRLNRTLRAGGPTSWLAGDIQFNTGNLVTNGTFAATTDTQLQMYGIGGVNLWTNNGGITKSGIGQMIVFTSSSGVPITGTGGVNVQGGIADIRNGTSIGSAVNVAAGTKLLVNATIGFGGSVQGAGTIAVQGGQSTFAVAPRLIGGTFEVASGARAIFTANAGAAVVSTLNLAVGAQLDLNSNDMILDYTGASKLPAIESLIASGRAAGAWTGNGIISTSAKNASPKNTTLGAMEASSFKSFNGAGAPFSGEAIDMTAVLIKYTHYGDTDFNGAVDFDDYSRTDQGFNTNRTGWINGDFDG
ncbi:MAG: hypothetical protein H7Z14_18050, partial [Anaerolineae bacterium]|nr:hypothetical protein [Phycisphaerae bacterium]